MSNVRPVPPGFEPPSAAIAKLCEALDELGVPFLSVSRYGPQADQFEVCCDAMVAPNMRVALTYVVDSKETMLRSNVFDAQTEPHGNMGRVHTVVQHLGPRGASSPEPERQTRCFRVCVEPGSGADAARQSVCVWWDDVHRWQQADFERAQRRLARCFRVEPESGADTARQDVHRWQQADLDRAQRRLEGAA
jgi:hypothetical protein